MDGIDDNEDRKKHRKIRRIAKLALGILKPVVMLANLIFTIARWFS